jgi:hypothetical protein
LLTRWGRIGKAFEKPDLVVREEMTAFLDDVRASSESALDRLETSPFVNFPVVATQENLRGCNAAEHIGSGVMGAVEETVRPERILSAALVVTEHPGDQPDQGVNDDQRRNLAAGQHKIAD